MSANLLCRTIVFGAIAAAAMFGQRCPARAASACPVSATAFTAEDPQATMYGFELRSSANVRGPVDGTIAVDTDRGWFSLTFHNIGPLLARFNDPVKILNAWVDRFGNQRCYPPATLQPAADGAQQTQMRRISPKGGVLTAEIRPPYGRRDCATPFAPPRALTIVEPVFDWRQASFAGTAVIDVTITPGGKPLEAKVAQSSGTPAFDDAAREAALKSTYAAASAYCLPTLSHYLYKAQIAP